METWRLFYDNLFDRPGKTSFDGLQVTPVTGYGWQRAVDGSRNTLWKAPGQGATPNSIRITAQWAGDPIDPLGGQWAVALFNHNCRKCNATNIEVWAGTAPGAATQLFGGSFDDMGPVVGGPRDMDYVWLTDLTSLTLPIEELFITIRFVDGPATAECFVGQVAVYSAYMETRGGPTAPMDATRIANRRLLRTATGDPAVTPALSQSMPFEAVMELQDKSELDQLSRLITAQRNGLPYAIHPHTFPVNGQWLPGGGADEQIEGKGYAWMVSPDGADVSYRHADRYDVTLSGIRQMGIDQWQ